MKSFTRRSFFKTSAAAIGSLTASKVLADFCGIPTGKQPLGPFFPKKGTETNPTPETDGDLTIVQGRNGQAKGQIVKVFGIVSDQDCKPIKGATITVWQASDSGRYNHNGDADNHDFLHPKTGALIKRTVDQSFQYWAQIKSGLNGEYQFKTVLPGFYPADLDRGWYRPPHIHFLIMAPSHKELVTQMYFQGETLNGNDYTQELNNKDLLLQSSSLTEEERRALIVRFSNDETPEGRFDIRITRI